MEYLEDRSNPSGMVDPFAVNLSVVATPADRINVVTTAGGESAAALAQLSAAPFADTVEHVGFGIYTVTLDTGVASGDAITYYSALPGVTAAEPDYVVQVERTPNDPGYSQLYAMSKISAPTAWDTTTGSGNFVVAVIDSGVDYNHPDLNANMWRNPGEVNGDGIDNDGNGLVDDFYGANFIGTNTGNPFDDNGHGTHVAGTIGAVGNNGVGVAGVNWGVKIMALKFLSASGSGSTSDAVEALNYAVANGAKVSNNSWGGGGYSSTLFNAIQAAQAKGHIFVAAAGNSNVNIDTSPSYPASYNLANVVAVASTTSTDARSSFSNYGVTTVDIAAPGSGIVSTTPNNTYSNFSGTSMASPHVAGAIALYWDANPTATATEVIDRLKATADTVSGLTSVVQGGKRLNVGALIGVTSPPSPPPPPADLTGARVTAAAFGGTNSVTGLRVTFNEAINAGSFDTADVVSFTGPNGALTVTGVTPVTGTNNTQFDLTFATQTAAGTYTLVLGPGVLDAAGNAMDQNANGTNGEVPGDRYTATRTITPPPAAQTFTYAGGSLAVRDFTYTRATIAIDQDITIADVNAKFNVNHTYDRDLVIRLIGPGGQTSTLVNRRGGSGNNFTNTTIDDEAGTAVAKGAAPFSGTYRPETALSTFDGRNARGTWTLEVYDAARTDTGSLTAFSLVVTGTNGGAAAGFAIRNGEVTFDAMPTGPAAATFVTAFDVSPRLGSAPAAPPVVEEFEPVAVDAPPTRATASDSPEVSAAGRVVTFRITPAFDDE
jgi:subtilisin family serine protease/subtilisin-like proprotein convertase family protein